MKSRLSNFVGSIRVLFSAICIASFILLTLLWARSYSWIDNVIGPQYRSYRPQLSSSDGWATLRYCNDNLSPDQFTKWTRQSTSSQQMDKIYRQMEESIKNEPGATFSRPTSSHSFGWQGVGAFHTPYWLPIAVIGLLAVAFGWKQDWRFSLKTMLTLTTVAAASLALIVKFLRI